MFNAKALVALLSIALTATASPVDLEKLAGVVDVPLTNDGLTYTAPLKVGSGRTAATFNAIVETGIGNTIIGGNSKQKFKKSPTSKDTGHKVTVIGGRGSFGATGEEWTDTVAVGGSSALSITNQDIAVSQNDGPSYLGLGPHGLTAGTVKGGNGTLNTVSNNLWDQKKISRNLFSLSYEPRTKAGQTNGELRFGDTHAVKHTGTISYVPITSTSPASIAWGVDASISYNNNVIQSNGAGVIDSGSFANQVNDETYFSYIHTIGAQVDTFNEIAFITPDQLEILKPLSFQIGNLTLALTPNAQIWPRKLNSLIQGQSDRLYLTLQPFDETKVDGVDFVLAQPFLERFYTVYDAGNRRVGFAPTSFTEATTN